MNSATDSLFHSIVQELREHLEFLYPEVEVGDLLKRLVSRLEEFSRAHPGLREKVQEGRVDERDVILITYGDQVQEPDRSPLEILDEFLTTHTTGFLSGVHILPFFPYTSDDGFAVADYLEVSPLLGGWEDIERIAGHFRLMVDLVVNHVSFSSDWFKWFRVGDPYFSDYFITVEPATNLSMVVRPRALPLLTPVETANGIKHVWTTFSADQVDLDFANAEVLLAMTDVLLAYLDHGARIIRMDAIAYLWKEVGTPSIHLPQTHRVVQFWRTVFDAIAPQVIIITETNVPHEENVSYFGDGTNEAQLVYNFPLPPLTLHAFLSGSARHLQQWAATLTTPSDETAYFNFLASHDGIGVRPAEGILSKAELQQIVDRVLRYGGNVSYKTNPDGSKSPYELNINYFDALNDPSAGEPQSLQVDRFMASQAILLSLAGVPGIYVHSLFGSLGWPEGVEQTGRYRTINREKFWRAQVETELATPGSLRNHVFHRYRQLIQARIAEPAFHPQGAQHIIPAHPSLFSFMRTSPDGSSYVLCIHNVSNAVQDVSVDLAEYPISLFRELTDLVTQEVYRADEDQTLSLAVAPYAVLWLGF
ncbi:MAG: alpha-amylase family glycosyl hydrolase [Chloroflexota bacterium]|nr:alpha-amylase family glycosyl hydrolase [Chloroflexota bacterium]